MNYRIKIIFTFLILSGLVLLVAGCSGSGGKKGKDVEEMTKGFENQPPNILFISVDDLNDWIEPLDGHPQAQTPNISRLAEEGVLFTRAYTPSPSCNPARSAIMTGIEPFNSGLYSNYQYWRDAHKDAVTLPQHLMEHGYWAAGAGKIFHNDQPDPTSWNDYFPSLENHMPSDPRPGPLVTGEFANMIPFEDMYYEFDWAPLDVPDSEMGDYKSVHWVIDQLAKEHDQPFFLAAGIYRPHLPWYVPQEYFDLFPLESVQLPEVLQNDLDDIPDRGREIAHRGGGYHQHVIEAGQWRKATQGYLASIAFADAMVGRLLEALDESPHADNTIVVLWGDHGWGLGEKEHWRKFALWEHITRVPLIFRVPPSVPGLPEGTPNGAISERTVSLIDLYKTLTDLAGIPYKDGLDGRSLVPLLEDPERKWPYPSVTTYEYGEFAVRDEQWRYIRYIDGSEELYNHKKDPV